MNRIIVILLTFLLCIGNVDAAKRTSKNVRQQKQQTENKIRETDAQIKKKNREITNALNALNLLTSEIDECNKSINNLNASIERLQAETKVVTDSIEMLDYRLREMQKSMSAELKDSRRSRSTLSSMAFIFASESFAQAYHRMQAVKQFSKWRERKAGEITVVKALLDERKLHLDTLKVQTDKALAQLNAKKTTLLGKQDETNRIVNSLKSQTKQLQKVMKQQQDKARELDNELDRLIAQEQREAEERARKEAEERASREAAEKARLEAEAKRQAELQAAQGAGKSGKKGDKDSKNKGKDKGKSTGTVEPTKPIQTPPVQTPKPVDQNLTGSFAQNKGKLPFPVDGHYSIVKKFGRQKHPTLPYVETNNSGIDIQTQTGATVLAVFDGEVSAIICPDGYNNVVLVKHGSYVTVYANLGSLSVRKGQKVSRGQSLGQVFIDTADGNRSVLHFEIRNAASPGNITKENPEEWLR